MRRRLALRPRPRAVRYRADSVVAAAGPDAETGGVGGAGEEWL